MPGQSPDFTSTFVTFSFGSPIGTVFLSLDLSVAGRALLGQRVFTPE